MTTQRLCVFVGGVDPKWTVWGAVGRAVRQCWLGQPTRCCQQTWRRCGVVCFPVPKQVEYKGGEGEDPAAGFWLWVSSALRAESGVCRQGVYREHTWQCMQTPRTMNCEVRWWNQSPAAVLSFVGRLEGGWQVGVRVGFVNCGAESSRELWQTGGCWGNVGGQKGAGCHCLGGEDMGRLRVLLCDVCGMDVRHYSVCFMECEG